MRHAKEQVNQRTEERIWFKHVLCLTMCNKGLRKLLNCNSYTGVNKTCKVDCELHTSCTRLMRCTQVLDIKLNKIYVTTELSERCHKQINADAVGWWNVEVKV